MIASLPSSSRVGALAKDTAFVDLLSLRERTIGAGGGTTIGALCNTCCDADNYSPNKQRVRGSNFVQRGRYTLPVLAGR